MCESRVLCEICKFLREALFAFHRNVISTAVFAFTKMPFISKSGGCCTLPRLSIVVPSASYAVVFN